METAFFAPLDDEENSSMVPQSLPRLSSLRFIERLSFIRRLSAGLVWTLATLVGPLSMPGTSQAADEKPAAKAKEEKQVWVPDRREFVGRVIRIDAERRILSLDTQVQTAIVYRTRTGSGSSGGPKTIPLGELPAADDLKVRVLYPPPATDEKGNPKRYTAKELKALKGPGNEWGYTADFDSLKPGQTVRFYLKWPKPAGKQAPRQPNATKGAEPTDAAKPVIATIHILAQPAQQ
jgi:hypothetical protein